VSGRPAVSGLVPSLAFGDTAVDPEFVAVAKKRKMAMAPMSGAELEKLVRAHLAMPAEIIRVAIKAAGME
jgi:hypothetical protein